MSSRALAVAAGGLLIFGTAGQAETVSLIPVADTNLFESSPDDNFGTTGRLQIGLNGSGKRGRGLYRFDPAAAGIPPGSVIEAVSLQIHVAAAGGGAIATQHHLRRVRLAWEEGETTWCLRRAPDRFWTVPGGGIGTSLDPIASTAAEIGGIGNYTFESTPALIADVQHWLDGTAANHGWALVSGDESNASNTRRISAREAGATSPVLTVEFTPFRITEFSGIGGGRYHLEWHGGTPPFEVDLAENGGSWTPVSGLSVPGQSANLAGLMGSGPGRVRDRAAPAENARYRVEWNATWSALTHPDRFPGGAHFSGLIGAAHDATIALWEPGGLASPGIESMAETGGTSTLRGEVNTAIAAGKAAAILSGSGIGSPANTSFEFDITQSHPLVTLVTMIAPSPDWFVGVHGLDLFKDGQWLESLTVALDPYDAGTDSGSNYTSGNSNTVPAEPISPLTEAPFLDGEKARPLGTFTFTRIPDS